MFVSTGSKAGSAGKNVATSSSNTTSTTSNFGSGLNETPKYTAKVIKKAPIRTWAGNTFKEVSFSPLPVGAKVEVCDSLKSAAGNTWYYIKYGDKFGFVYSKYVEKVATTTTSTAGQYRVQCGSFS